jgi:hypothetical protein
VIYSNDASFSVYYNFHFPSSVEFAPSDIYTPQTKCASKPTETEETITIDVDAFDICFVDFSVELIDYDSDDDTIEDFYNWCYYNPFDANDLKDIPEEEYYNPFDANDLKDIPEEEYYNPFDVNDLKDIPDAGIDWTPLLRMQRELDKLGAWARQSA